MLLVLFSALLFVLLILHSSIKINVKSFEIENLSRKFKFKCNINVGIFILKKIKVLSLNIFEDRLEFIGKKVLYESISESKTIKKIFNRDMKILDRNYGIKSIKNMKPKVEKLNLKLDLSLEDVFLTVFSVALISAVLGFFMKKIIDVYNPNKYKYTIMPHYKNANIMYLNINSIITIKTVHIIYVILKNKKRRVDKNERSSYRGAYENSNEQYTGYGRC